MFEQQAMKTGIEILYFIGALAVVVLIGAFLRERQLRKHKGLSREEFINEFTNIGIPSDISEAVYKHYTASVFHKKLRIAPEDSLDQVFQKGEDDIDDDVLLLMKKLGLKPPCEELRLRWTREVRTARGWQPRMFSQSVDSMPGTQPIETLRDMVLWLDWVRRHQPASRENQNSSQT